MGALVRLISIAIRTNRLEALCLLSLLTLSGCNRPALVPTEPAAGSAQGSASQATPTQPGAAGSGTQARANGQPSPGKSLALVRVFYATDRARASRSEPAKSFGGKRGTLSFGSCEVGITKVPPSGKPENPPASRLEFKDSPDSKPALRKVVPREYEAYLENLKAALERSPKKNLLVFVHGYNVTFADAARRTAQMKYDLGFDGPAVFFSWPSQGRAEAYAADEADVEWAQPDLKEFLKDVAGKTRARSIYLLAHGMGNRALAKAYIYLISERPELKKLFREVILVAPDMDSDLFKRDIAPALAASSVRTTLYSSSRDPALRASDKFQNYPRAGDSGSNLILFEGIETIDASNVSTALGKGSQAAGRTSVLADIYRLIRDGKKPGERNGLKTVTLSSGQYWKFRK
jgi:esterase/lipase superfamily enzyme